VTNVPARIAGEIQTLIKRGTLSPGVHLCQTELAGRFATSRVPVREALKLLAAQGTLRHDLHRGFFVAALSSDEARQLYRIRHLVELELLATVAWPDAQQLARLEAMAAELKALVDADDRPAWAARHREFQLEVFALSPQKRLLQEVVRLWTLTDRYRSLLLASANPKAAGNLGRADDEESRLLAALRARDRAGLIAIYDEERANVESVLLSVLRDRGM
jgi:DNA-binding GntR family transcriptional regulator